MILLSCVGDVVWSAYSAECLGLPRLPLCSPGLGHCRMAILLTNIHIDPRNDMSPASFALQLSEIAKWYSLFYLYILVVL